MICLKILRETNCYSFIFGKQKKASLFTGQSPSQQMFASELSLEVEVGGSCWAAEEAGAVDEGEGMLSG